MRGDMENSDPDAASMGGIIFHYLDFHTIFEKFGELRSLFRLILDDILLEACGIGQNLLTKLHLNRAQEVYCARHFQSAHRSLRSQTSRQRPCVNTVRNFNRTIHRHRRACAMQRAVWSCFAYKES